MDTPPDALTILVSKNEIEALRLFMEIAGRPEPAYEQYESRENRDAHLMYESIVETLHDLFRRLEDEDQ
jgi:hypothetical protein